MCGVRGLCGLWWCHAAGGGGGVTTLHVSGCVRSRGRLRPAGTTASADARVAPRALNARLVASHSVASADGCQHGGSGHDGF